MKERYEIIKKLYPDYLIILAKKEKIHFMGDDWLIVRTFKYKNLENINILKLDGLEIEYKKEYDNNMYYVFLWKAKLIQIIDRYRRELIENEK